MTDIIIYIAVFAAAFISSAVLTGVEIPILKMKQFGQFIREEGPESHLSKQGTPTMGGIAIYIAIALTTLISGAVLNANIADVLGCIVTGAAFGMIGFADDYIKVAKKHNLGLTAGQKLVMQILFAICFGIFAYTSMNPGSKIWVPFADASVDIGMLFVPFVAFVIVAMSNSVNLTDGLDGLSAGVTGIIALGFAVLALLARGGGNELLGKFAEPGGILYLIALSGAAIGFLVWNKNPAKIFMGDTGSMALGAGLTAAVFSMGAELLLPVAGAIYVAEALSVIIQVAYFKKTGGKRFFRMAPLHHHFELGGMGERRVVVMFWLIAAICTLLMLAISGVIW